MSDIYQEQIDDLRARLVELQTSILSRAKKDDTIDLNDEISQNQIKVFEKLDSLEGCIRELQEAIFQAREDLRTHSH